MKEESKEDVKIFSSLNALKEFREGSIWKDFQREIFIWGRMAVEKYDGCTKMEEVTRIHGIREALNNVLQLPDIFIKALELKAEEGDKRGEENE